MTKLTKVVQNKEEIKNFFKFNTLLKKRISTTKIKIKNLNKVKDLKMGIFSNAKPFVDSFSMPGAWYCISVDKNKYKKKAIKNKYKFLNLKVKCFFLIKNKEKIRNSSKFIFIAILPIIKDNGKI